MQLNKLAATACLALAVSAAPFTQYSDGAGFGASAAFAKDKGGGNGGGGGGGGGNGGGKSGGNDGGKSSGKNGGNGRGSQTREARSIDRSQKGNFFTDVFATIAGKKTKSDKSQLSEKQAKRPTTKSFANQPVDPVTTLASVPMEKPKTRPFEAKLAGLNSLNRNYHAYLNSSDPRMAAIRDYAVAYATYEIANGVDTLPTDATLDDEALRAALEAAAKPGTVIDDEMLGWAKMTLGVGSAVGKIDEIREELASAAPVEPIVDPVVDPVVDPGDEVVTAPDPVEPTPGDVALPPDPTDTASVVP
jgi:hypothetical protein